MGVRYWTAMGSDLTRRRSRFNYNFGFEVGNTIEPEELNTEAAVAILVGPTNEDFERLGNAFVVPYTDEVFVAFSPHAIDHTKHRRERSSVIYGTEGWKSSVKDSVFLVEDGKRGLVCDGCSNLFTRAAGGCMPGVGGCNTDLFETGAQMTVPPMDLYLAPKKCCNREAFESYYLGNLCADVSVASPVVIPVYEGAAHHAGTTKMLKSLLCKHCIFSYGDRGGCTAGHWRIRYCQGPYFAMDVPQPSQWLREALRLMGKRVSWSDYITKKKSSWDSVSMKVDSEIKVTLAGGHIDNGLALSRTKGRGLHRAWLTKVEDWPSVQRAFKLHAKVPKEPATVLERLACVGLAHGRFSSAATTLYGHSSSLVGVTYCDGSDDAYVDQTWDRHQFSIRLRDVGSLASRFFGVINDIDTGERGGHFKSLLDARKDQKSKEHIKRLCSEIVGEMVEADRLGQSIPDVHGLMKECEDRVKRRRRKWLTRVESPT